MANNIKPYFKTLNQEAAWTVNGVATSNGSGGTVSSPGLFNGIIIDEWNTANVMYWSDSTAYIDITVNDNFNIWRSGTTTWTNDIAPLKISQWNGTAWVNITSSVTQTVTPITNIQWEKTISNLPAGRYKFEYAGLRIDSEWYLEGANKPSICNIVSSVATAKIGDIVPCRYSATNYTSMGVFSALGSSNVADMNPYTISSPDGVFYWVMVGYDLKGRKKFIADRNIHGGLAWDTINTAGLAIGNSINYNMSLPLVGAWNMNEVSGSYVYDIANRYNGTVTGATIMSENNNYFRRFDNASDNNITYTNPIIPKGKKSIRFKFRTSNINTSEIYFISTVSDFATNNKGLQFSIRPSGQVSASFWNESATIFSIATNDMDYRDGSWHTVLFEWDGTTNANTVKLYVDSMTSPKITGTSTTSDASLSYTNNLVIGRLPAHSTIVDRRYKGDFSNLEIYNDLIDPINTTLAPVDSNCVVRLLTGGVTATDKNNEWDQIIVNSTLNNTIVAGDNYIWNDVFTPSPVYSWTSTVASTNTNRVVRGGTATSTYTSIASTTSSASYGFRPMLLVESLATPATFLGQLISSSIHTQDAELTGTISHNTNKVKYSILVNGNAFYDNPIFQSCPLGIDVVIPNSVLNLNQNKITIVIVTDADKTSQYDFYVTVYDNAPSGVLSLSDTTVHAQDVELTGTVSDIDLDLISYRILINNVETLTWSTFESDPIIDYIITNSDLVVGSNKIRMEFKDNFRTGTLGAWEQTIIKTNVIPDINLQVNNGVLNISVADTDNDLIRYRININNNQVFPASNNLSSYTGNYNINYAINRDDINVGVDNIATVYLEDILGGNVTKNITFKGEYIGLMFMDENHEYYTTDIGELLKYLDFGTITLGQTTEAKTIIIKNQYGFDIQDLSLTIINNLPNINIEFSLTNDPFIPEDIFVSDVLSSGQEMKCYVRLSTFAARESVSGTFQIIVKAQPV